MIHHYARVMRKDWKLVMLVLIFIALGVAATMLANQCGFIRCEPSGENPAVINLVQ